MRRYIAAVLAAVLCVALMAGCKSMPDEMADAVKLFTEQVDRITSQTAEAGELVAQAEELIASKKPVADSSTITKLQSVVNDVKENVINFELPKRPGLGVELNKELVIEENKTPHNWKNPVWRHADGSVAEW